MIDLKRLEALGTPVRLNLYYDNITRQWYLSIEGYAPPNVRATGGDSGPDVDQLVSRHIAALEKLLTEYHEAHAKQNANKE